MGKIKQGRYVPVNPAKYAGDPSKIINRSGWELRVMDYLDKSKNVVSWSSEEVVVPYRSPIDNRIHRYFPDFVAVMQDKDGNVTTNMIEVKPYKQTIAPKPHDGKRKLTKRYLMEVATYGINSAKWTAAEDFCADRGWFFKIMTEKDLKV